MDLFLFPTDSSMGARAPGCRCGFKALVGTCWAPSWPLSARSARAAAPEGRGCCACTVAVGGARPGRAGTRAGHGRACACQATSFCYVSFDRGNQDEFRFPASKQRSCNCPNLRLRKFRGSTFLVSWERATVAAIYLACSCSASVFVRGMHGSVRLHPEARLSSNGLTRCRPSLPRPRGPPARRAMMLGLALGQGLGPRSPLRSAPK